MCMYVYIYIYIYIHIYTHVYVLLIHTGSSAEGSCQHVDWELLKKETGHMTWKGATQSAAQNTWEPWHQLSLFEGPL